MPLNQKDRARSSGSLTLERGLRVLDVLSAHPEGLTVSELAGQLATHRAGVYRLLGPLLHRRLVTRDQEGLHTLGAGLTELANRVRPRLQAIALPELRKLADELGATTALTIRDHEDAVVLAVVEPRNTDVHIAYRPGLRHALDQAASGIAILAALEPRQDERDAIVTARERGWALSSGELIPGATGVAAAIGPPGDGVPASISAVWIEDRDAAAAARLVMQAAAVIGQALQ